MRRDTNVKRCMGCDVKTATWPWCKTCCNREGVPCEDRAGGINLDGDPAAHYRQFIRARITDEDIARGYTEVKLDPYRVCDAYDTGGGPREQMVKKLLRWTDKGQSDEQVLGEIESALTRWKQMREECRLCK